MMKAEINASTQNIKSYQRLNSSSEAVKAATAPASSEQELLKEFNGIMDKIAAKLNDNLGCDYNSLLDSVNSTQISQTIANIVPVKAEVKESQSKSQKQKEESDDVMSQKEEQVTTADKGVEQHHETETKSQAKETKSAQTKEEKETSDKASVKECDSERQAKEVQAQATQKEANTNSTTKKAVQPEDVKVEEVKTEQVEQKVAVQKGNENPAQKVIIEKNKLPEEISKTPALKNVETTKVEQLEAVGATEDVQNTQSAQQVSAEHEQSSTNNSDDKQIQAAQKNAILADDIMRAALTPIASVTVQKTAEASTANLVKEAMRSVIEAMGEKGSSSLTATNTSSGSLGGSFALKNVNAEQSAARTKQAVTQPQMLKNFERVESALKEAAKAKDGKTISLRLDPPDLGTVKVDVSLREGSLHARVSGENSTVNNLLREKAHELQATLRKLGLDVDKVTVSVGTEEKPELNSDLGSSKFKSNDSKQEQSENSNSFTTEQLGFAQVQNPGAAATLVNDHWIA